MRSAKTDVMYIYEEDYNCEFLLLLLFGVFLCDCGRMLRRLSLTLSVNILNGFKKANGRRLRTVLSIADNAAGGCSVLQLHCTL